MVGGRQSIPKTPLRGTSLAAVFAERVALFPARSDLVGGLPFASLFVFIDLTRIRYFKLLMTAEFNSYFCS